MKGWIVWKIPSMHPGTDYVPIMVKHLFKHGNEHVIERLQTWVDEEWEKLLKLEAAGS